MRISISKLSALLLLLCLSIFTMQVTVTAAEGEDSDTPSVTDISVKVSNSKLNVGQSTDFSIRIQYGNGIVSTNKSSARITIDKPHILKFLDNGKIKATAVGEASINVEAGGVKRSLKISASASEPMSGAKVIKGVTYLPLMPVIKALGGTVNYDAPSKSYGIQIGKTKIAITRDTAKAKVDGKAIVMKGAPIVDKGQTLFTSDLLVKALGASLQWDAANYRITISLGSGKLIVNAEKPKPANTTGMYEVAATGEMAGWKILKGHPYEKSIRIYFKYDGQYLSVMTEDIRKVNLNQKVTWTDENGNKHVNTVGEIYDLFSYSNAYTDEWLYARFGNLYADWLASTSINADQLVTEYLTDTGQMETPQYTTTLGPNTEVIK
ncbi:copper amine oxidase N-terminal domain-containing protein [Paenibacillus sp. JDR-2]|uniref:copper amine oxidase N-terminal domain-containing protein n=1 Tax=Paenibacillus sp. (strain JDR-2) TaxID=324057 RepID=UPI0001667AAC|nr:copper amine oxidase N-terminal domain-containing protein [Paenibacillus sp. JDR-2]ACT02293.1 copper amine oxidase domain protein [Paenibacillus sp. JDR-2]